MCTPVFKLYRGVKLYAGEPSESLLKSKSERAMGPASQERHVRMRQQVEQAQRILDILEEVSDTIPRLLDHYRLRPGPNMPPRFPVSSQSVFWGAPVRQSSPSFWTGHLSSIPGSGCDVPHLYGFPFQQWPCSNFCSVSQMLPRLTTDRNEIGRTLDGRYEVDVVLEKPVSDDTDPQSRTSRGNALVSIVFCQPTLGQP